MLQWETIFSFLFHAFFCTDLEGGERLNISLEYYKVFYQAAATGSITMAAETLCISCLLYTSDAADD